MTRKDKQNAQEAGTQEATPQEEPKKPQEVFNAVIAAAGLVRDYVQTANKAGKMKYPNLTLSVASPTAEAYFRTSALTLDTSTPGQAKIVAAPMLTDAAGQILWPVDKATAGPHAGKSLAVAYYPELGNESGGKRRSGTSKAQAAIDSAVSAAASDILRANIKRMHGKGMSIETIADALDVDTAMIESVIGEA